MQYSHCPESTSKDSFQKDLVYGYFRVKKIAEKFPPILHAF